MSVEWQLHIEGKNSSYISCLSHDFIVSGYINHSNHHHSVLQKCGFPVLIDETRNHLVLNTIDFYSDVTVRYS